MVRLLSALTMLLFAWGCGPRSNGDETIPPPRGKSLEDYLGTGSRNVPGRPEGTVDAEAMKVHFIDIGQGSATLFEFPCGVMLVDTGGELNRMFDSQDSLLKYLDAFFERRKDLNNTLDVLVITHPHIDHTRSIETVLSRYTVKNVVDNGALVDDLGGKPQIALHEWIEQQGGNVGHLDVRAEDIDGVDGMTSEVLDPIAGCDAASTDPMVHALWGGRRESREMGENANNNSVTLRVVFGKSSLLLTGDLELLSLSRMYKKFKKHREVFDVDIYVVGHHGSKNATAEYMMKAMTPGMAVISSGPYERQLGGWPEYTARAFGHPNKIAFDQLVDPNIGVTWDRAQPIETWIGVKGQWKEKPSKWERRVVRKAVYATSWDGTVVVTANTNGWITVETVGK